MCQDKHRSPWVHEWMTLHHDSNLDASRVLRMDQDPLQPTAPSCQYGPDGLRAHMSVQRHGTVTTEDLNPTTHI